jgi:antitoxin FitA
VSRGWDHTRPHPGPRMEGRAVPVAPPRQGLGRYHIVIALGWRPVVGQLLVRNVNDQLIRSLKERAARNGRSVEAEHRDILEKALGPEAESFFEVAARLRAETPPQTSDSAALIRADRDRDHLRDDQ